ncbi:hypothetical protein GQ42DRAFT_156998 [Ramicandelaber brevisporus]|nr:hypothetical protein GQ42DRAFT_156998 [Ramicandelaber brevisporus]
MPTRSTPSWGSSRLCRRPGSWPSRASVIVTIGAGHMKRFSLPYDFCAAVPCISVTVTRVGRGARAAGIGGAICWAIRTCCDCDCDCDCDCGCGVVAAAVAAVVAAIIADSFTACCCGGGCSGEDGDCFGRGVAAAIVAADAGACAVMGDTGDSAAVDTAPAEAEAGCLLARTENDPRATGSGSCARCAAVCNGVASARLATAAAATAGCVEIEHATSMRRAAMVLAADAVAGADSMRRRANKDVDVDVNVGVGVVVAGSEIDIADIAAAVVTAGSRVAM